MMTRVDTSAGRGITLACKITICRLLGVPVFVLLMLYYTMGLQRGEANEYQRVGALLLFVVVALTDALDGFVARSRGEITALGRILDPLADKALLISALLLLTRPSLPQLKPQFPVGFTLLVISRDVFLIAGAVVIHALAGRVSVRPCLTGKAATVLQMTAAIWALARGPQRPFLWLVWSAGVFVAISAVQYLVDGIRQMESEPDEGG